METIALRQLEEHVRKFILTLPTGDKDKVGSWLWTLKQDLEAISAIREVDEATDVTDAENPLIRKHDD